MDRVRITTVACLLVSAALPPALAQTPPADAIPPQARLGQRIQKLRDVVSYTSCVVIVSDPHSYIDAISSWSRATRFPVLIDDGSVQGREDIARFVRAFAPERVVRWNSPSSTASPGEPAFNASVTTRVQAAISKVWGVADPDAAKTTIAVKWQDLGHQPPGLVFASPNDPAWTAALPLAAAWGQPLIFLEKPSQGNIDGFVTPSEADSLEARVQQAAKESGLPWRSLGDTLESVTLCMNIPERIAKGKEFVALSDRIGREGEGLDMTTRWAWTGHVFGTPSQAAYRAMCSLFLHPRRAWIFDGYPDTAPWNQYDGTKAAQILEQSGIRCEVSDTPSQGAPTWRTLASRPVTADLLLVNTKGNNDFFDLEPGQCKPGDLPMLARPAALHFVHSWSLLFPGKRETVGGRWLERGVFVYAGSVHEPFLQAFTPTPAVAGRLMAGAPFAPSIRQEGQPVWKIAVLGDPLYTPGPAVRRTTDPLPFEGAVAVDEGLRELLQQDKWEQGVLALKLLGRDADIAKIAQTLLENKPQSLTPPLLREGILAAFRSGRSQLVFTLFAKWTPGMPHDGHALDAVWLAAGPLLAAPDPAIIEQGVLLQMLKDSLRPEQFEADARLVLNAWSRQFGVTAATQLLAEWKRKENSAAESASLEQLKVR